MARVLRMPGVAANATDAVLSEWLVDESGEFGAADPIAKTARKAPRTTVLSAKGASTRPRATTANPKANTGRRPTRSDSDPKIR